MDLIDLFKGYPIKGFLFVAWCAFSTVCYMRGGSELDDKGGARLGKLSTLDRICFKITSLLQISVPTVVFVRYGFVSLIEVMTALLFFNVCFIIIFIMCLKGIVYTKSATISVFSLITAVACLALYLPIA